MPKKTDNINDVISENRPVENKKITLVKMSDGKLSEMSIGDLLDYKKACDIVYLYYDNIAQIEMTNIEINEKVSKYNQINTKIMDEIIRRLDVL